MKKGLIITLSIIAVIIIGIAIGVILNKNKNDIFKNDISNISATGYFYGKPNSVEDIYLIEISYNNDKDGVAITDNKINYYGYDEQGNYKYENIIEDEEFAQDITNYIYKNNLKYLDQSSIYNVNWSLQVYIHGGGCAIGGNDEQPEWFNKLLEKLEVDKYRN